MINRVAGGKSGLIPLDKNRRRKFAELPTFQQKAKGARTYRSGKEYRRGWKVSFWIWGNRRLQPLRTKIKSPFDFLPTQAALVGAHLRAFTQVWVETCSDQWVTSTILRGHFCKFKHHPPRSSFLPTKIPSSKEKREILLQYVQMHVHLQAVVPVPKSEKFLGFYSPVFLVPKKVGFSQHSYPNSATRGLDGLYRPPRHLPPHTNPSQFLSYWSKWGISPAFPMSTLWHIDSSQNLCESGGGNSGSLWEKGIRVLHYLDDILILSQDKSSPTGSLGHADQIRMANQLCKKPAYSCTENNILGGIEDCFFWNYMNWT